VIKEENGLFKILRMRHCREVEKSAHGKCLGDKMKMHHLAQDLLELITGSTLLKEHKCWMFNGVNGSMVSDRIV